MSAVADEVLLARAYLSRVAEPASIPLWAAVREHGPVATAAALRSGRVDGQLAAATAARADRVDPRADLAAAARRGIRLVVPESDDWPHFALSALEATGLRRLAEYRRGRTRHTEGGELVPPLALWVKGPGDLPSLGVRSVGIVGSRAATEYGTWVATDLAARLAQRGFAVVSGGAYGIDAAAHQGALGVDGQTVLVSAGGLDAPYPTGNARLFDRIADAGLVISESPPGSAPRRRRFLTRNRLIAALSTGTVVVEAAARSGAMNTAAHCTGLGRMRMAVPGPITSHASAGCHALLAAERDPARLVTGVDDVLACIGSPADLPGDARRPAEQGELAARLAALDPLGREVFDGLPARSWCTVERLAFATGRPPLEVLRALPALELAGLVESAGGEFRIACRPARRRSGEGSAGR